MKFIELFAGIGGFRLGLEQAGHECIWSNEWLPSPRRIYAKNFGEYPYSGDIRNVTGELLPEADLIVGGFPCATFSVAGKRTGFGLEDTRGTLCFEMFRLAQERRIPYLLFENVKGLLGHDNGRTFGIILAALDEMGYDCQWELLNSKNFGVPQHRERIFLIANLRGKPRPKVFPLGRESLYTSAKNDRELRRPRRGLRIMQSRSNEGGAFRTNSSTDIAPTVLANFGTGGNNVTFIQEIRPIITPDRLNSRVNDGTRVKAHNKPAYCLGAQDRHGVIIGRDIRKLTPLECERLQGLPDNFTKYSLMEDGSIKETSDGERYERCGRTVTIPIIKAIGDRLYVFD